MNDLIEHNPLLKKPVMAVLSLCEQGGADVCDADVFGRVGAAGGEAADGEVAAERTAAVDAANCAAGQTDVARCNTFDRVQLEAAAAGVWGDAWTQTPAATIDILVRNGAFAEQVLMNGEPYAGALEDMQLDESVPDDAEVAVTLTMTQAGRELLQAYEPASTMQVLFNEKPHYRPIFKAVLEACASHECSRAELEDVVNASPLIGKGDGIGQQSVYPQYFLDALERAGGIEWQGAWRATEAGRAFVMRV